MRFLFILLIVFGSVLYSKIETFSAEINIKGKRIIIKTDDGNIIDTNNLTPQSNIKIKENKDINENGISIGGITNNGGIVKDNSRNTNIDNVVIIRKGETSIYNKK